LSALVNLKKNFDAEWTRIKNLTGWASWQLCTDNKNLINKLAQQIDKAEEKVLQKITLKRTTKEAEAIQKSDKAEDKEKAKFFTLDKGEVTLTAATNDPKIHEVLGQLFPNKNKTYKIDYSGCTNPNIKNKMISQIGTNQCWISYDSKAKTYLIKGPEGELLSNRALIWEGVKLIPEDVASVQETLASEKESRDKTNKLLNKEITSTEQAELQKQIPVGLRTKLDNL
jgi:hypothetical protein